MKTCKIKYSGNLRTEVVHERSGSELVTDAPVDNKGLGRSFSPTDLVAVAQGTCMLTVMGIRAASENWNLEGMSCEVLKTMGSGPRRIVVLHVEIVMPSHLSMEARRTLERIAIECPVAKSLSNEIEQITEFSYVG